MGAGEDIATVEMGKVSGGKEVVVGDRSPWQVLEE